MAEKILWRVTFTIRCNRRASEMTWISKKDAQEHADMMNRLSKKVDARIVKDAPWVRRLVP